MRQSEEGRHVAAEAVKEASVLKEQRKAREEKALLKKP